MSLFVKKVRVTATPQGDHGVKPPTDLIERTVQHWLADLRFTEVEEVEVQVECRRYQAANGFYGVRALYVPLFNPCSLEVRVRGKGDQYQWACHLILPTNDAANKLLIRARPDSVRYYVEADKAEAKLVEQDYRKRPGNLGDRAKAKARRADDAREKLLATLRKRATLFHLCAHLEQESPWAAKGREIPLAVLYWALEKTLKIEKIEQRLFNMLISELVTIGILDVIAKTRFKPLSYISTPLVPEYAQIFHEHRQTELVEELQRELTQTLKLFEATNRETERMLTQLEEAQERSELLSQRAQELTTEIKNLKAGLQGDT